MSLRTPSWTCAWDTNVLRYDLTLILFYFAFVIWKEKHRFTVLQSVVKLVQLNAAWDISRLSFLLRNCFCPIVYTLTSYRSYKLTRAHFCNFWWQFQIFSKQDSFHSFLPPKNNKPVFVGLKLQHVPRFSPANIFATRCFEQGNAFHHNPSYPPPTPFLRVKCPCLCVTKSNS